MSWLIYYEYSSWFILIMKNIIVVTGGAGFVGSNLISFLLKKTRYQILSLDNYLVKSTSNEESNEEDKLFFRLNRW